jgi:hypothetical protein
MARVRRDIFLSEGVAEKCKMCKEAANQNATTKKTDI